MRFIGEGTHSKVYEHVRSSLLVYPGATRALPVTDAACWRVIPQYDEEEDKPVAVKKMYRGRYSEGVAMPALTEMQVLQEIDHPNVLNVRAHQLPRHDVR